MGWWIALAILVGLAVLPLGVSAKYNADGARVFLTIGAIRIKLYPRKKKPKKDKPVREKKPEPAKKKPASKSGKKPQKPKKAVPPDVSLEEKYPNLNKKPGKIPKKPPEPVEEETGGSWKDFLSMIPIVLDFLGDFRRKLRVDRLEMKLIMASNDPCDLAINYGKAWAAVGSLMPQLERVFKIRKRNVEVACDFLASETKVIARVDVTMTLGRMIVAVCKFAFHALVEFLNIKKKRKGGAVK